MSSQSMVTPVLPCAQATRAAPLRGADGDAVRLLRRDGGPLLVAWSRCLSVLSITLWIVPPAPGSLGPIAKFSHERRLHLGDLRLRLGWRTVSSTVARSASGSSAERATAKGQQSVIPWTKLSVEVSCAPLGLEATAQSRSIDVSLHRRRWRRFGALAPLLGRLPCGGRQRAARQRLRLPRGGGGALRALWQCCWCCSAVRRGAVHGHAWLPSWHVLRGESGGGSVVPPPHGSSLHRCRHSPRVAG